MSKVICGNVILDFHLPVVYMLRSLKSIRHNSIKNKIENGNGECVKETTTRPQNRHQQKVTNRSSMQWEIPAPGCDRFIFWVVSHFITLMPFISEFSLVVLFIDESRSVIYWSKGILCVKISFRYTSGRKLYALHQKLVDLYGIKATEAYRCSKFLNRLRKKNQIRVTN